MTIKPKPTTASKVSTRASARGKTDKSNPAEQLSDQKLIALSRGSQREDRTIAIPETLEDDAIAQFATSLIDIGLAEEASADRGQPVWRQDQVSGQPITLCITDQALVVLGIDEGDAGNGTEDTEVAGRTGQAPVASHASEAGPVIADPTKVAAKAPRAATVTTLTKSPIDGPQTQSGHVEPPQPRSGSKQGQLIGMLSREEGVSIGEIASALGWLPHTTRAALTGLRHKGYELGREINGERGSIYRITATPIMVPAVTDAVQAEAA